VSVSSLLDLQATSVRPPPIQHGIPPSKAGPDQIPNVSMDAGSFCSGSCSPIITQAPDASNLYFSDQGCDFCGGGSQTLAEDFNLGATQEICEIVYWGGYYAGDSTPADSFDIIIHSDSGGIPGAVVYSESGVAPARFQTGNILFGVHEWQYSWVPSASLVLTPGTYWVEIWNRTGLGTDDWGWETGAQDGAHGPNIAFDFQTPGVNWNLFAESLAMVVCSQDAGQQLCSQGCDEQILQSPNQVNGFFSDSNCGFCGGQQSIADDVTLATTKDICEIVVWGGYFAGDSAPADDFTLIVHADAGGIPGAAIYTETGMTPTRVQTGVILFGVHEWQYSFVTQTTLRLAPGTYWIEIFNNIPGDDWFWETGNPGNVLAAFAFETPGVNWNQTGTDMALALCTEDQAPPPVECNRLCDERLNQPADAVNGYFSDAFCDLCGGVPQVIADNFSLSVDTEICDLVLTGGYFPNNSTPVDNFTVRILGDTGSGIPDDAVEIFCEVGGYTTRTQTGNIVFGVNEWEHRFIFADALCLPPGVYWLEVYNNVQGDDWFWETGSLDASNGVSGSSFAFQAPGCAPGTTWNAFGGVEFSARICGKECILAEKYCVATNNSTGAPADLTASGTASVAAGNLTLSSSPVPNQFGIFFHGENEAQLPFGNGFQCVTNNIVRGKPVQASGNQASYTYDNSDAQHSLAGFEGLARKFQYWFRDPAAGGAFFNTSNALNIYVRP
jgi:hypothetical protein